jgi:hypothetical protein
MATSGDDEYPPPLPGDDVELLELADTDAAQDLGHGLQVDAKVSMPAPRRKRDTHVLPPRRWPRVGSMGLRKCPRCHCVVPSVSDGFWHEQAMHGVESSADVDADEWAEDLIQEVGEYREAVTRGAAKSQKWRGSQPGGASWLFDGSLTATIIGLIVLMVFAGIISLIVLIASIH